MSTRPDLDRSINEWLVAQVPDSAPERLLEASRARIRNTRQRRAWWPARRDPTMNSAVRLIAAAAAVVVVALIGYQWLTLYNLGGPDPIASPSQTESPSSTGPSPIVSDSFPPSGQVLPGTYAVRVGDIQWSFDVAEGGWSSTGDGMLVRGARWNARADGAMLAFDVSPIVRFGIYADPCGQVPAPALINPTAAEVAQELTRIPGVAASDPTQVMLGGLPAEYVVLTVPEAIDCDGQQPTLQGPTEFYYLWYGGQPGDCGRPECGYRYATVPPQPGMEKLGSTVHVWVVEIGGSPYWLEGETYTGASDQLLQEFQSIVDSIRSD
jgi:hypothetical protein